MVRFSDTCTAIDKAEIGVLARELDSLADLFVDNTYKLIKLKTGSIGVCADILTKANSKSCLHRTEPVVIVLAPISWQEIPPLVFPDRNDFPYKHFPHVFYKGTNYPAGLCLLREDIRDWYSEHNLRDYVIRLNEWMQDAARKSLIKLQAGDEYEPQRYHGSAVEASFYRLTSDDVSIEKQKAPSCHYSTLKVYDNTNAAYGSDEYELPDNNALCIRLFRGNKAIDDEWIVEYPHTLRELYDFIERKGYPYDSEQVRSRLDDAKEYVYYMIALLRPTKIIGKESRIDYLCFRAKAADILSDGQDAHIDEVLIMDYPNMTTARNLSITPASIYNKRVVILGCGAIGSKIALHLYRSGIDKLTLVDYDKLEPHNLCRHALICTPFDKERKKVKLMRDALNGLFLCVPDQIETADKDAVAYLKETDLKTIDVIVDATASSSVMHGIDNIKIPDSTRVVRACLSQRGDIGIINVTTGSKRLLFDFYAEILRLSITDDDISNWLNQEKKNSLEDVRIGEGCHSYTMKVSDDTISSHAALMSNLIRHINEPKSEDGFMLSFANDIFPGSMGTTWYSAPDYCEFICDNDREWRIRIHRPLLDSIRNNARAHGKKESGGYLFGQIDFKRRLIYVLSSFIPEDSKHNDTQLELSKKGFPQYDKRITSRSAGQVFYIGDWHSHPSFPLIMSDIDIDTCRNRVLPAMREEIGICIITKAKETKAFLVSDKL